MFLFNHWLRHAGSRAARFDSRNSATCNFCEEEEETDLHAIIECREKLQLSSWLDWKLKSMGCTTTPSSYIRGDLAGRVVLINLSHWLRHSYMLSREEEVKHWCPRQKKLSKNGRKQARVLKVFICPSNPLKPVSNPPLSHLPCHFSLPCPIPDLKYRLIFFPFLRNIIGLFVSFFPSFLDVVHKKTKSGQCSRFLLYAFTLTLDSCLIVFICLKNPNLITPYSYNTVKFLILIL